MGNAADKKRNDHALGLRPALTRSSTQPIPDNNSNPETVLQSSIHHSEESAGTYARGERNNNNNNNNNVNNLINQNNSTNFLHNNNSNNSNNNSHQNHRLSFNHKPKHTGQFKVRHKSRNGTQLNFNGNDSSEQLQNSSINDNSNNNTNNISNNNNSNNNNNNNNNNIGTNDEKSDSESLSTLTLDSQAEISPYEDDESEQSGPQTMIEFNTTNNITNTNTNTNDDTNNNNNNKKNDGQTHKRIVSQITTSNHRPIRRKNGRNTHSLSHHLSPVIITNSQLKGLISSDESSEHTSATMGASDIQKFLESVDWQDDENEDDDSINSPQNGQKHYSHKSKSKSKKQRKQVQATKSLKQQNDKTGDQNSNGYGSHPRGLYDEKSNEVEYSGNEFSDTNDDFDDSVLNRSYSSTHSRTNTMTASPRASIAKIRESNVRNKSNYKHNVLMNNSDWIESALNEVVDEMEKFEKKLEQDKEEFRIVKKENQVRDLDDVFEYVKQLGSGGSCRVILAKHRKRGKYFALKQLKKNVTYNSNSFCQEIKILQTLKHKNIVTYDDAYIDSFNYYIATQYCRGGPLLDHIRRLKYYSEHQATEIIKTLLDVILYCHNQNIVHRDLKPSNIMYSGRQSESESNDEKNRSDQNHNNNNNNANNNNNNNNKSNNSNNNNDNNSSNNNDKNNSHQKPQMETKKQGSGHDHGELKVIDWGDALRIEDNTQYQSMAGTIIYMAPEIIQRRPCYGWEYKKSDMWSLGVIAYVLVCGRAPFRGHNNMELQKLILKGAFAFPDDINLSNSCKSFINALLTMDTKSRLSAKEAYEHEWLISGGKDENLGKVFMHNLADFYQANLLKQLLVAQIITEMSRKEKKVLMKAFREIDTTQKGYVTRSEISKYLMKKTSKLSQAEADKRATAMMKVMDRHHKGYVSVKSFVRAKTLSLVQNQFSNNESIVSKSIEVFDPTDSGYIETSKIQTALKETTSHDDSEYIVNTLDPHNTGRIAIESFIQVTSTHTTPRSSIMGSVSPRNMSDDAMITPDTFGTGSSGNNTSGNNNNGYNLNGIQWSALPIHENNEQFNKNQDTNINNYNSKTAVKSKSAKYSHQQHSKKKNKNGKEFRFFPPNQSTKP